MKLLIVDDSAVVRRAIGDAYEGSVFTEIETASDGMLAVTMFKKMLPDVVTLDITMPHMDGLAALAQILEIQPSTTVLVISALADHHTAVEALLRGADQFICKPFTDTELMDALDDLLEERKQSKSNVTQEPEPRRGANDTGVGSASSIVNPKKERPSRHMYPSGYVEAPNVKDSIDTSPMTRVTAAVNKQKKFIPTPPNLNI